ncbi:MAG: response regulator, partial [Bacillota bacterium]
RIVREGLKFLLVAEEDLEVAGEADSGIEALRMVEKLKPHVVLLDFRLNDLEASEVCRQIIGKYPDTAVIILTAYMDDDILQKSLEAGSRGFLLKNVEAFDLVRTIRAVAQGEIVIDRQVAGRVLQALKGQKSQPPSSPQSYKLSQRQKEVLALLSQGMTDNQIARQLYIAPSTVRFHIKRLMEVMNCLNRLDLLANAFREGILA